MVHGREYTEFTPFHVFFSIVLVKPVNHYLHISLLLLKSLYNSLVLLCLLFFELMEISHSFVMLVVYLILGHGTIIEMQMFQNHKCKYGEIYTNETIMKYLQKL